MNNRKTSQGFANVSIKILKYVVMVVIIVVCATTAFNFGSKIFDSEGVDQEPGTDMTITVSEGTNIKSLGKTLKEYGIIKDATVFNIQSKIYKITKVKPGTYNFNTSQSNEDIFSIIKSGPEENKKESETQKE